MDRGPTNVFKTVADVSVDNIFFSQCFECTNAPSCNSTSHHTFPFGKQLLSLLPSLLSQLMTLTCF